MSIYDVFSGGSRAFNKEEWAAQKQEQRKEAYGLIDKTCGNDDGRRVHSASTLTCRGILTVTPSTTQSWFRHRCPKRHS